MLWFVLIFISLCGSMAQPNAVNDPACLELADLAAHGAFTGSSYSKYCILRCESVPMIVCDTASFTMLDFEIVNTVLGWVSNRFKALNKAIAERDEDDIDESDFEIDFKAENIIDYLRLLSPLTIIVFNCIVATNVRERYATLLSLSIGIIYVIFSQERVVSMAFILLSSLIAVTDARKTAIPLLTQGSALLLVLAVSNLLMSEPGFGVISVLLFVTFVIFCIWKSYKASNSDEAMIVILLIILSVMSAPLLVRVMTFRGRQSFFTEFVIYVGRILLPYGRYSVCILNIWANALSFIRYADSVGIHTSDDAVFYVYWLSVLAFVLVRALFGWYAVYHSRAKLELSTFAVGAYVYCIDGFYAPFHLVGQLLKPRYNWRALAYYFATISLMIVEYYSAKDVLFVRFMIGCADLLVIKSGFDKFSRYLSVPIDLNAVAFPKVGALSWISLQMMIDLSESVVNIVTADGKKGKGFIRKDKNRNMKSVITVKHVADDQDYLVVDGVKTTTLGIETIGSSDDPVVSVEYHGENRGVAIECLTSSEIPSVNTLWVVSNGVLCAIPNYDFGIHVGSVSAVVNVMQGDSGSPVFAVLKTGDVRLCGVVSRGVFSEGSGNLISCVVDPVHGSPGFTGEYVNFGIHTSIEKKILTSAVQLLQENSDDLAEPPPNSKNGKQGKARRIAARRTALVAVLKPFESNGVNRNLELALQHYDAGTVVEFNTLRMARVRYGDRTVFQ